VQTVHQGVDVTEIHQSFQPDICFMDIMLPKLNGYDACKAVKETAQTPVVLMWSGFMELDSEKYNSCGAEDSIEKPFETKTLRDIVQRLVPSLSQNEISSHLIFEESDAEPLHEESHESLPSDVPSLTDHSELPPLGDTSFDEFDTDDATEPSVLTDNVPGPLNVEEVNLESAPDSGSELPEIDTSFLNDIGASQTADDDWTENKIGLTPEGLDDVDSFSLASLDNDDELPFEKIDGPEGLDLPPIPAPDFGLKEQPEAPKAPAVESHEEQLPPIEAGAASNKPSSQPEPLKSEDELIVSNNTEIPQLSKDELKRLILAQSKDIIESVVWDVVPELAKEMIQKEINRLTGEVQIESDLR